MASKNETEALDIIRNAIREVMGSYTQDAAIKRSTWTATEDRERGLGWAGGDCLVVITTEDGLLGTYEPAMLDAWMEVQDKTGYLVEPYNAAIICVYP